VLRKSLDRKWI